MSSRRSFVARVSSGVVVAAGIALATHARSAEDGQSPSTVDVIVERPDGTRAAGALVTARFSYRSRSDSIGRFLVFGGEGRARTDVDGRCRVECDARGDRSRSPAAAVEVVAELDGFSWSIPAEIQLESGSGQTTLRLRAPVDLSIRVRALGADGAPVVGARLTDARVRGPLWRSLDATRDVSSGEDGIVRFGPVPSGRLDGVVRADGFVPVRVEQDLADGVPAEIDCSLPATRPVRVVVTDEADAPIPGAVVVTLPVPGTTLDPRYVVDPVETVADASPATDVRVGLWPTRIVCLARGWAPQPAVVDLTSDAASPCEVRFRLVRTVRVRFRVATRDGSPLPDLVVRTPTGSRAPAWPGAAVTLVDAAPRPGGVLVCVTGYAPADVGAMLGTAPEQDLGTIVVIDRGVELSGRVLSASGDPVVGARVSLVQRDSAMDPSAVTSAAGKFRLPCARRAAANEVVVTTPDGRSARFAGLRGDAPAELRLE